MQSDFGQYDFCLNLDSPFLQDMVLRKYLKTLLWMGFILFAISIPSSEVSKIPLVQIPHFDKLVHFTLFFVLTILLISESNPLRREGKIGNKTFYKAALLAAAYGLLTEVLQYYVFTSRSGSILDLVANLVGVAIAILSYRSISRLSKGLI